MAALRVAQLRAVRISVHCPHCDAEQYLTPTAADEGHTVSEVRQMAQANETHHTCNSCDEPFRLFMHSHLAYGDS